MAGLERRQGDKAAWTYRWVNGAITGVIALCGFLLIYIGTTTSGKLERLVEFAISTDLRLQKHEYRLTDHDSRIVDHAARLRLLELQRRAALDGDGAPPNP